MGIMFTSQNSGDDDTLDSDINPDDGKSDTVTISDDNNLLTRWWYLLPNLLSWRYDMERF